MPESITVDPRVRSGVPVITGTGVSAIQAALDWHLGDIDPEQLLDAHRITRAQLITACWYEARHGHNDQLRHDWADWLHRYEKPLWCGVATHAVPLPPQRDRP